MHGCMLNWSLPYSLSYQAHHVVINRFLRSW